MVLGVWGRVDGERETGRGEVVREMGFRDLRASPIWSAVVDDSALTTLSGVSRQACLRPYPHPLCEGHY